MPDWRYDYRPPSQDDVKLKAWRGEQPHRKETSGVVWLLILFALLFSVGSLVYSLVGG